MFNVVLTYLQKNAGFEVFGDLERKEVNEVLQTGVLMRYGFDQARAGNWKALAFEEALH